MGSSYSSLSPNLSFQFISNKSEASQKLLESEQKDFYLEECYDHVANAKARERQTYRPNSISHHDLQSAMLYVESVKSILPRRLMMDLSTISIIQLMPTADDGMPHTRPHSVICFPDISQLFSITTLKHELWHIHQRIYQEEWLRIFESIGWKPWSGKLPEKLELYRRLNPDTIDHPNWVFRNTWVPIPVFQNITHPKVSEVDICFYHITEQYHTRKVPTELQMYFSGLSMIAFEHPREITAYLLSEPEKYGHSQAFQDIIDQMGHISI
jgi:hypothetical protein